MKDITNIFQRGKLIIYIALLLSISCNEIKASGRVTFTAEAPETVVMGQQFNLVYTSNREIEDFRIPEIKSFEILMGPSTSTMSSTSIINGKYSSTVTFRYTYVLLPKSTGTFRIAPATATLNRTSYRSNGLTIRVLPSDKGSSSSARRRAAASPSVSSGQVFIRAIPSKTNVCEQEAITMTYKLYTREDISGFENPKFPEFKGFMAQEVQLPQNQQFGVENYKGQNYRTAILKQTVLYPRETGTLTIEKGSFDVMMRLRVSTPGMRSIFDDFLDSYEDVKKTIYSNPVKINVKPLPFGKPSDFCGVAGNLSMRSTITGGPMKANQAVTIKIIITGSGNLKMIPNPELNFPEDFEVYDPKVDNSFKVTSKGVVGSKTIEYLVIPRFAGNFKIPAASISYYDLTTRNYRTLKTGPFILNVGKGSGGSQTVSGSYTDKEQLRLLNSDVRYLKNDLSFESKDNLIYGKSWFWIIFVVLGTFFTVFLITNRKLAKANADISRVRTKKASKVAVKRLKKAAAYLKENNKEAFYDEVLRALWGYTSDKLNIPMSRLTKETVDSELSGCNVSEEIRKEFTEILQTCEYARYAPDSSGHAMDELYGRTMEVMNKMENTIKR